MDSSSFGAFMPGLAILVVLVMVGAKLNGWRSSVFPMGVFAIGGGIKRHETMEKWRSNVVIGGVVGFIASIVAGVVLWMIL